jgi:nitrogen PTS system EIIA component
MHFGATLRLFRMERGIGLRELARQVGVSGSYLSRVENGHDPPPTPDRLAALADVLGIDRAALTELAGHAGPEVTEYLHRVPAAASFLLELAKRGLGTAAIARLRALLDQEFPEARPRTPAVRCTDLLSPERIVLGLRCTDLDDVFSTLVTRLPTVPELSQKEILDSVRERSAGSAVLLGGGFALPHASLPLGSTLKGLASVAVLAQPLRVPSPDGEPLGWAALVLLPHGAPESHAARDAELTLLASFARLAAAVRGSELAELHSEAELYRLLVGIESTF